MHKLKKLYSRRWDLQFFLYPIFFIFMSLQFFNGLKSRWVLQSGDAAGYVDVLSLNSGFKSFQFAYGFSTMRLYELLATGPTNSSAKDFLNPYSDKSFFEAHPYLIGYLVRLIHIPFLQIETIPLLLLAISYASGITILVKYARKNSVSNLHIFLLLAIVFTSPIFIGSLIGQPYLDRLIFGPFIIIILGLIAGARQSIGKWILIYALIVFCILTSERSSLMVGILVIAISALTYIKTKSLEKFQLIAVSLGLAAISWYFFWVGKFSANKDIANNSSIHAWLPNLKSFLYGDRQELAIVFILALSPFLLFAVFLNKYFLILIIFVVPNVLVSIGGAELSGFATHYHAMYLPMAVSIIFISIAELKISKMKILQVWVPTLLCLALTLNLVQGANPKISPVNIRNNVKQAADALGIIPTDIRDSRSAMGKELSRIFGLVNIRNASISLPEGFMPASVSSGFTKVSYFPIGIGESDYLVVPFTNSNMDVVEFSIFGVVPEDKRPIWSSAILKQINRKYIKVASYKGFYGYISLYKRVDKL